MTSCLTSTQKESTPMRTTSRLIRTVLVAAGLLAISASAAQAMPTRQSTDATDSAAGGAAPTPPASAPGAAANPTIVFHRTGFLLDNKLPILNVKAVSVMQASADSPTNQALVSVMQSAADSPTDQTAPLVISHPVPAPPPLSASSGFDWAAAGIGAAVAALLLILAG